MLVPVPLGCGLHHERGVRGPGGALQVFVGQLRVVLCFARYRSFEVGKGVHHTARCCGYPAREPVSMAPMAAGSTCAVSKFIGPRFLVSVAVRVR